jgi:hypothetical protein
MPLHGKGLLIVFAEVKPEDERDFNEWYNREHIDERVSLPGFHRARRYVAVRATPKFLALYECDTVGDLATPGYLHLLANPTPWTQAVTGRFTRFHRLALAVQADLTHGVGGAVAAVRFVPDPQQHEALVAWLHESLPKAIARPGMLGAAVAQNDLAVANAPLQDETMAHRRATEVATGVATGVEWVALMEGADAAVVGQAARLLFKPASLKKFGVSAAPVIGTYRLLFGNQR